MAEQQEKAKKEAPQWSYGGLTCAAWTKSEARAMVKKALGLDRLPPGAAILRKP